MGCIFSCYYNYANEKFKKFENKDENDIESNKDKDKDIDMSLEDIMKEYNKRHNIEVIEIKTISHGFIRKNCIYNL